MALSYPGGRVRQLLEDLTSPLGDGRTFFVTPVSYARSGAFMNSVSGKGPGYVFTTLSDAFAACEDGRGDVIQLLPGDYQLGSELSLSKSSVTLRGFGSNKTFIKSTGSGTGSTLIKVTAASCTIEGIGFRPKATAATTGVLHNAGIRVNFDVQHTTIKDCSFTIGDEPDDDGRTAGVSILAGASFTTIDNCYFGGMLFTSIHMYTYADTELAYVTIKDCRIGGTNANITHGKGGLTSAVTVAGTISGLSISGCMFVPIEDAAALSLDDTSSSYEGCSIVNNHFCVDTFNATEVDVDTAFVMAGNTTLAGMATAIPA